MSSLRLKLRPKALIRLKTRQFFQVGFTGEEYRVGVKYDIGNIQVISKDGIRKSFSGRSWVIPIAVVVI